MKTKTLAIFLLMTVCGCASTEKNPSPRNYSGADRRRSFEESKRINSGQQQQVLQPMIVVPVLWYTW